MFWTLVCRVLLSNQGRPYTCDPPASALTALYHTDCALSSQGLVMAGWAGEGTQYVFQAEVLFLLDFWKFLFLCLICKHLNLGLIVCTHLLHLIFLWVWWCNFIAFLGGWVRGDGKFKAFLDTETLFQILKKCASETKKMWQPDLDPWTNVKVGEETWSHRVFPWPSHVCLGMCTHTYYISTNKYTH